MASISLPPFLSKLKMITTECDPEIAGWSPCGSEFLIKSDRFETQVLSKYFKGSKSTFIRQLHFYCFKKLDNKGQDFLWAFSHPKFKRDAPHLIYEIRRKTRTENSGPASKDEVQALRTEMVKMRTEMDFMQNQIARLTKQLETVMMQPTNTGGQQQQQMMHNHNMQQPQQIVQKKKPKRSLDSDSDSDGGVFAGMLPFEDGSSQSYYNNSGNDSPRSSEGSEPSLKKPAKESMMQVDSNMEDFSSLFFGIDALEPENTVFTSSSQAPHQMEVQQQQQHMQQSQIPPRIKVEQPPQECTVCLVSMGGKEATMPNDVFAGFLSKFVEHSILLQKKNMLVGDLDPELEIFVHASLPVNCPLKDLLTYAKPAVRTVLVNVLSDVSAMQWMCGDDDCSKTENIGAFLTRPILSFTTNGERKEISGECFLHFLSFLLRAAITDDPQKPVPTVHPSTIFKSFDKHFSPQVYRIMTVAHHTITEAKKKAAEAAAASGKMNPTGCSS